MCYQLDKTPKLTEFTRQGWRAETRRPAAVSCSHILYRLGGVKMGLGLMGKLGRAWIGAWVSAWACDVLYPHRGINL